MKYKIGQKFSKTGGDYSFTGIIVAAFTKLNGMVRYVGENEDGLLFIFNEAAISPEAPDPLQRTILINARSYNIAANTPTLSYEEVATMAGLDPERVWTCVWSEIHGFNKSGSLIKGQSLDLARCPHGLSFNIMNTSNA